MSNYEKITASPEALAEFLVSLPVATGPWDETFHKEFCDWCEKTDCDVEGCPHQDKRNNPLWWLMQGEKRSKEESLLNVHFAHLQGNPLSPMPPTGGNIPLNIC